MLSKATAIGTIFVVGMFLVVLLHLSVGGAATYNSAPARPRIVEANIGVVAADHVLCSDIGVDTLKKGGNAIDAAIATAFCLGVVNPAASGLGGGDFMLVRLATGHAEAFDFRETAPLGSSESMYANNIDGKTVGGLAVAVPGEVKGLYLAWKRHGSLPWKSLLEPSIRLANEGFPLLPYLASQIQSSLPDILASKSLADVFAPNGVPLVEGDICSRKTLAMTLKAIAEKGSDAFYKGPVAKALVEDVQAAGGILSLNDLRNYRVKVYRPVVAETWGHTVLGFPPPSSGGPGLILILNILAAFKNARAIVGDLGLHHIVEAFKHTYAVRAHLGDPSFVDITSVVKDMLSPEFAASLQKTISDNTTYGPAHYGGNYHQVGSIDEHGTSHMSVVDGDRNAVSMTCTVNFAFGSKLISEKTGILLNNEMDDFATPEDNSTYGVPAKPNFIEPKKRPLSTMSPTILLKNGQLKAVIGGSGGIRILTTVAQVILDLFAGIDPLTAVQRPRVHHQYLPNKLFYDNYTSVRGEVVQVEQPTRQFLLDRCHDLTSMTDGAVSQLILQDMSKPVNVNGKLFGKLIGVSDLRKDGYPAGY